MGCDGGTIPTRDELVRLKKKPEQKDKDSERLYKWQHCSLSQEPLAHPIFACELGRLYNKESVIKLLLDQKDPEKRIETHLKSLKDIKVLELTENPGVARKSSAAVGDNYVDRLVSPWICPITGLEMNGRFKFVFDWTTGKVLSDRAAKMIRDDPSAAILEENRIILNPEDEDLNLMMAQMEARRARMKASKKLAKRKLEKEIKIEIKKEEEEEEGGGGGGGGEGDETENKKIKKDHSKTSKISMNAKKSSLFKNQQAAQLTPTTSKVQNDPGKSDVYKSLFSSHSSAQNKPKGNWVTFDPRYN